MNKAVELFTAVPKQHNCAQAVADGCGRPELCAELAACGGGKAPEGRCGALFAALLLVPESSRAALRRDFVAALGAESCRELKGVSHVPCADCVRTAAELAEKYR